MRCSHDVIVCSLNKQVRPVIVWIYECGLLSAKPRLWTQMTLYWALMNNLDGITSPLVGFQSLLLCLPHLIISDLTIEPVQHAWVLVLFNRPPMYALCVNCIGINVLFHPFFCSYVSKYIFMLSVFIVGCNESRSEVIGCFYLTLQE